MKEIFEKVKNYISEKTGHEKSEIKMDSYFMDDLNIDEMELSEIIANLEETYQTEFDLEIAEVKTVSDLVHAISDATE